MGIVVKRAPSALAVAALAVLCAGPAVAGSYKVTRFDAPGATYTTVTGVNKAGAMAGTYVTADSVNHGFVVVGGTFTSIDGPFAIDTEMAGINNAGTAAGYFRSSTTQNGFFWSDNTLSPLALGVFSRAVAINAEGHVAGFYGTKPGFATQAGFLYRNGKFEKFKPFNSDFVVPSAMNNSDDIVGVFWDPKRVSHSFLRKGSEITGFDPPGSLAGSYATGINEAGQIVGFYADKTHVIHGYLYDGVTFTTIDAPVTTSETKLMGINSSGQIVGFYGVSDGSTVPFVYTAGTFAFIDVGADTVAFPTAISDNQTVVGSVDDGTVHGFVATCPRAERPCTSP